MGTQARMNPQSIGWSDENGTLDTYILGHALRYDPRLMGAHIDQHRRDISIAQAWAHDRRNGQLPMHSALMDIS